MNFWLGVVCRDHVQRGTRLGIAQLGHGRRDGLARLKSGDWIVYYSPRTSLRDGEILQAFTAIGSVEGDEIWQADEGSFQPWRRRVEYLESVKEVRLRDAFASQPRWTSQLRFGLVQLPENDFEKIRAAMVEA